MILLNQSGILLRIILVLAILLRIVWIWQEVSAPEAENIRLALLPMFEIPLELADKGHQPPLYPFLLSAFALLSDHPVWLRLSSVLAGVFLVIWMFRLGSYWGTNVGNMAALIAALLPPFIQLSVTLTHGIWACLFAAMALYYFWRWVQTRRAEALFVYEVCLLLLLYTAYIGLAWFAAFNILFLAAAVFHRAFYEVFCKRWWVNQLLLVFFYLPWILQMPGQSGRPEAAGPLPAPVLLAGLACFLLLAVHHLRSVRRIESRPEVMRHVSLAFLPPIVMAGGLHAGGLASAGIPLTLLAGWSIIQVLPQKEGP